MAEAIASSELERAKALYDEAVRVENSYRTYSEELLAAWGLTLAGTPLETDEPAAGSGGGYSSGARKAGSREEEVATAASEAASLRQQLSRIPGLTQENKAAMIRDYYADGRITYADMQSLLAGI